MLKFARLCEWLEIINGNKVIDPTKKPDYDRMFKEVLFPYGLPTAQDSPTSIDSLAKLNAFNKALLQKQDDAQRNKR